jgi:parvulin-like peptidyl-prolyl isomerase
MKNLNIILAALIGAGVSILTMYLLGVLQWSQPSGTVANNAAEASVQMQSRPAASASADMDTVTTKTSVELEDLRQLVAGVDANQRGALLGEENAFKEFVEQEAINLSLLAAARANKLEEDPQFKFLIQRRNENTLRELYLNRVINNNLPADFPSEEQIRQYYDNNRDSLALEEHVSVWQIFLPISPDMDADRIAELGKQADQIADDIKTNRTDYSTAAIRFSRHQPSRMNGGYMGLLKVSELLTGIDKVLLALDEGEVSSPVRTDTGFHILKRGAILPAQEVTYEQVQEQIRNVLINQARVQIRNKINEQVAETYPVVVDDASIEQWRSQLRADLQ